MDRTVKPEQFEKAILDALSKYGDRVMDVLEAETKSAGRQTARALKQSAPAGGKYAKGWSHKQKGGAYKLSDTVYNRTDYQLTHLLEKPHPTGRNKGGHYPKKVDYTGTIASVEEQYANDYYQGVLAKL